MSRGADVQAVETDQVLTADAKWSAIMSRSTANDGRFVYGVSSTGVYCRPSCPARRPGRDKVDFFPDPDAAEAAGYRPCLRCHPRFGSEKMGVIESLCNDIESKPGSDWSLQALSRRAGMSPSHFHRTFKRALGITPREYVESVRFHKFRELVRRQRSVRESTYTLGYSTASWPYPKGIGSILAMDAKSYRRGGAGQEISYSTAKSSQGMLLVAWTRNGICFIAIKDTVEQAKMSLRDEYPSAIIQPASEDRTEWIRVVLDALERGDSLGTLALPLDIRGTAFRWKVWKALLAIPPGKTLSYAEVARKIGSPRAARAIGNACSANPVALVIPCHRVLASDGSLRGYRWGVERKRSILRKEGTEVEDESLQAEDSSA